MRSQIEEYLTQTALKLNEKNKLAIKAVTKGDFEQLTKHLDEFAKLKKEIKSKLVDCHFAEIKHPKARDILQKISLQESLSADKMIKVNEGRLREKLDLYELDDYDIENLGSELFYSWFSHYEYIRNLYGFGSLILGISVPSNLQCFVSEARLCYAFQQHNAVYSLCRTILEATIKDICLQARLVKPNKNGDINFESYTTKQLRDNVSIGSLNDRIKNLYRKTSLLIHGNKTILDSDAADAFYETLKIVQELYSTHEMNFGEFLAEDK